LPLAWNGNPHPQIYKALIKLLSLVFTQSIQLSNIVEAAPERGRANLEIAN